MAVFRVERNTGYTVMSNHHLRNKELSLKAKGLLSQMLSLPEDWDYTLSGLSYINRESIDAIRTAVWELEKAGYITRRQGRDEKGKMTAIEYTIYEQPQLPGLDCPVLENPTADNPISENPTTDNPTSENPMQLNKDISRTNLPKKEKSNTDLSSTHSIPIHFLNPLPYGEDEAAQPPERKRTERNDAYRVYEEIIKDNIAYDILLQDRSLDRDRLNEIVDLMFLIVSTIERGNVLMNEEKMNAPCAIGTKGAVTTGSEQRVPIHLKLTLTIKEAAEYSNIGINKIDTMLKQPNCPFVLYVGTRKLVKRREFEEYIRRELTI